MRFTVDLDFNTEQPFEIPSDYRNNLALFIAEAVKQYDPKLYSEIWSNNKNKNTIAKPFTFACYLPDSTIIQKRKNNSLSLSTSLVKINISSSDIDLLNKFYKALLNLDNYSLFNYPVKLKNFSMHNQRIFTDKPLEFDTLSPVIVKNDSKKSYDFLYFDESGFETALTQEVIDMYRHFVNKDYNPGKNEIIIAFLSARKIRILQNIKLIKATIGKVKIYAKKEIQQLIYDAGLGMMRNHGFGMLEVAGKGNVRRK